MADLVQSELDVIAKEPLSGLDFLIDDLRQAEASDASNDFQRRLVSRLILVMMSHDAAYTLQSTTGSGNVLLDLNKIVSRIQTLPFHFDYYRPLTNLVIGKASDVKIWAAVYKLIHSLSHVTPPTSILPTFDSTPFTSSSASFQRSEQTRKDLEPALFHEIRGCTYRNVTGFFDKYFGGRSWIDTSNAILKSAMDEGYEAGRWTEFPDPPNQDAVWDWLSHFQNKFLPNSRSTLYTVENTGGLTGGEAKRQLDLLVTRPRLRPDPKPDWQDVLVVGELEQSKHPFKSLLLQLVTYIRDVFSAQPTRRFVHSFFIHGTIMELWVFDRSGPYSSGEFDIHEKPENFIRAITGYALMDDDELGLDTFIEQNDVGQFVTIQSNMIRQQKRVELDNGPFVRQRAVVCRGTTCFRARDNRSVVKFSWTSDKRPAEAEHLAVAREKGVEGVAEFLGYQYITSIAELRSDLIFPSPHSFRAGRESAAPSLSLLQQVTMSSNSPRRKRQKAETSSPKKRRSSSRKEQSGESTNESLYASDPSQYSNRNFGCLAISPAGRALHEFISVDELLTALRDAVKAHRSLYLTGGILHRDVSENNIIITNPAHAQGFTGMLIDLDLAKVVGSGPSGARHQTGTREFMAIQVLQ